MKNPNDGSRMPAELLQKLNDVRRHDRRVRLSTGLLRSLTILLGAMLVAMAIDWVAVLQDERWRWTLTLLALAGAAVGLIQGCLLPLLRSRTLTSIARDVDQAHPSLEERYLTLAEFAQSQDAPEVRGSESMIQKVAQQAAAMSSSITADSVISRSGLVRARKYLWGITGVLALLFALNFPQAKILCERFWAPGCDISLTRLEAKTGDIVIGKGDNVTLEIIAKGKATDSASLFIRSQNGRTEVIPLKRETGTNTEFAYTQSSVADSFEYRARSGDGQTAWHRITVMDRPKISQVKLRIIPPAYSRLPLVEEPALPRQVRALEGSQLEVSFQSDQPLASMALKFSDGLTRPLTESPDHSYHFNTTLSNRITFTPVLANLHHLDNLAKPSCEVEVYPDQPPSVTVISPNNEITARPDDKVKIEFEARDDFGLTSAELVATVKSDTSTNSIVIPIPLQNEAGAKLVRKQVELDLAQFKLKQDQELSYFIRVTDSKQNPGLSSPGPSEQPAQDNQKQLADAAPPSEEKQSSENPGHPSASRPNDSSKKATPSELAKSDRSPEAAAPNPDSKDGQSPSKDTPKNELASSQIQPAGAKNPSNARQDDAAHQDNKIHLAMNGAPPNPSQDAGGSQPPPNNMSKRALDVAQSACCSPMKIMVDEWGRSFEGQVRDKLEIAIDPTLKLLDDLLGKAQQLTDATLATGRSPEGLSQKQHLPLETAKDQLRQADSAVSELKKVSQGTPYAFVSLQIHDIRETHISPARKDLGAIALEPATVSDDQTNLQQASFQIKTAREKLANLTRTYESVKRDNKLADAMQRLTKMHQIFLEDTQAMLGSKKPILNPLDRKVAEVSDEYAEKLRKLLEEKKKIVAELAKILADDPRLLRRYMALEELDGTTLRDQMTLLAKRQQSLAEQVVQWAGLGEKDRNAWLAQSLGSQAIEQNDVAMLAVKMQENMVTWLPLEVPPDTETVVACRNIAGEAARLAAEAARQTSGETLAAGLESSQKALGQLRLLQASLPGLEWVPESGQKLSQFEANRMNETAVLITRQSGWIKKIEALRAGNFPQAAEVDQHRLMLDTTELGEKLDATATSLGNLSAEINSKAKELNGTVHQQVLPEQSSATDSLSQNTIQEATTHQTEATNAFARANQQFDDLLHLITAKLDAAPPPEDPGRNKSLEELLAQLQEEKQAAEKLGIPCRPINVNIQKDWLKPGSGSNSQQARAQTRAAQEQARSAARKTQQTREQARKLAQQRVSELAAASDARPVTGPKHPAASWNTLVSKLGDEIRQGRDNVPPEQYRQAIEQYFNTISESLPAASAPADRPNP